MIEEFLGRVSLKTALLVLISGYVFFKVCMRIEENIRLKRLGSRGTTIPTYLPFGKLLLLGCHLPRKEVPGPEQPD